MHAGSSWDGQEHKRTNDTMVENRSSFVVCFLLLVASSMVRNFDGGDQLQALGSNGETARSDRGHEVEEERGLQG